jgi:hypothetical protein
VRSPSSRLLHLLRVCDGTFPARIIINDRPDVKTVKPLAVAEINLAAAARPAWERHHNPSTKMPTRAFHRCMRISLSLFLSPSLSPATAIWDPHREGNCYTAMVPSRQIDEWRLSCPAPRKQRRRRGALRRAKRAKRWECSAGTSGRRNVRQGNLASFLGGRGARVARSSPPTLGAQDGYLMCDARVGR